MVLNNTIRSEAAVGEGGGSAPDAQQNHLDGRRFVKMTVSWPHSKPNKSKLLRVEPGAGHLSRGSSHPGISNVSQVENHCAVESSPSLGSKHLGFKSVSALTCAMIWGNLIISPNLNFLVPKNWKSCL